MILGVSEWLSPKLDLKPSHIRIGFLAASLFFGTGIGVYLILWLIKVLTKLI